MTIITVRRNGSKIDPEPIKIEHIEPITPIDTTAYLDFIVDLIIADEKAGRLLTEEEDCPKKL